MKFAKLRRLRKNSVKTEAGCWEWQKSLTSAGYGQLTENGTYWTTHRYALSALGVDIAGKVVRHLCHNTKCCNPRHLATGTHKDNYADSLAAHAAADQKQRKVWIVQGVAYTTCKQVVLATGLSMSSVIKYTKEGVFDVESYREACKRSRDTPKV